MSTLDLLYEKLVDRAKKMRAWHRECKKRNYSLPRADYDKMKTREREVDQIISEIEQFKRKKQPDLF